MDEQELHHDLWNKKLQQVPVPDIEESWNEMHMLLDKELPVVYKNDRLKWVILLLLLLCVGVCNCPGVWRRQASLHKGNTAPRTPATAGGQKNTAGQYDSGFTKRVHAGTIVLGSAGKRSSQPARHDGVADTMNSRSIKHKHASALHRTSYITTYAGKDRRRYHPKKSPVTPEQHIYAGSRKNNKSLKTKAPQSDDNKNPQVAIMQQHDSSKALQQNITQSILPKTNKDTTTPVPAKVPVEHAGDTLLKAGKTTDAHAERGFAFAMGINHTMRIGQQQPAAINTDGTSGILADYLPVPQLRYYFSKKAYIQAEAQLNAPQYTKKLLLSEEGFDTSGQQTGIGSSVFIKKLFYFNIPLSVHYSPFNNFFIGTGLQFSTLRHAVALFEQKQFFPSRPDSTLSEKVQGFEKNDTLYSRLNTTEWRILLDVNYQWKRFTPGIRYNRAFTRFINVPVSNTHITQARNQSLQLYLRYVIWRRPGRRLLPAK